MIAAAVAACCVTALVVVATGGHGASTQLTTLGIAGLVAALAWTAYWRPEVEVSDGGVRVVNPWRTVHVPWPALDTVSDRWSLTLTTTDGRRVSAFAAPARGLSDRGPGVAGRAATLVSGRREQLRAAGYLDEVHPEGAPVTVSLALGPVLVCSAALVLAVAGLLLPG